MNSIFLLLLFSKLSFFSLSLYKYNKIVQKKEAIYNFNYLVIFFKKYVVKIPLVFVKQVR